LEGSRAVWRSVLLDGVAWTVLAISAFGLFATVFESHVFSETGGGLIGLQNATWFNSIVDGIWAVYMAVLRPLFLVVPALDAYALTYSILLLVGLTALRRRLGWRTLLLQDALLSSALLLAYEIGLALVSVDYLPMHVTNIQVQLGLGWFSNLDLLEVSAVSTLVLVSAKRFFPTKGRLP